MGQSIWYGMGPGPIPGGQSTQTAWAEARDTRLITEELQTGTIKQTFYVSGRADEAYTGPNMGGMELGAVHPFYSDAFLIRREFRTIASRKNTADRRTAVTLTWQKRPCLEYPEMSTHLALVSMPTWYSYDDPPVAINDSIMPIPVLQPQIILTLRWPNIVRSLTALQLIESQAGHTLRRFEGSNDSFLGYPHETLLFEGMDKRLLYGKAFYDNDSTPPHWELVLTFRIDPIRKHKYWVAKTSHGRLTNRPASLADLESAHNVTTFYPESIFDFNLLLPNDSEAQQKCSTTNETI